MLAINKNKLSTYVLEEPCVFQCGGELMMASEGKKSKSAKELSCIISKSEEVQLVTIEDISEEYYDLANWGKSEQDIFIFVEYDLILCIPRMDISKVTD